MKLSLTAYDLKTLDQDENGLWFYAIYVEEKKITGSEITTKEEAVKHAERKLLKINRTFLSRKKIKTIK